MNLASLAIRVHACVHWMCGLALVLVCAAMARPGQAQTPADGLAATARFSVKAADLRLDDERSIDLLRSGQLFIAQPDERFPADLSTLPAWLAQRQQAEKIDLLGGSYWLYLRVDNQGPMAEWVLDASNSLIERIEARIFCTTGRIQALNSGYRGRHQFMLHYGQHAYIEPGATKHVLIRLESPFFRSYPRFEFTPVEDYRYTVLIENLVVIGCLGTLLSLSIFYTFAAFSMRERSQLWYAAYLLCYGIAWAFVFHVPSEILGFRNLHWHYVPFFLLPILNTFFYRDFLQLKRHFPRLYQASYINFILPALLLPSCFIALPYAHSLATVAISVWLSLALVSGIACWRSGFRPARYFVMAFVALMLPALVILPANLGLMEQLVRNAELFTLLGGTIDGLLLAFAIADRVKLLSEQKDAYLARMNEALALAHTDALTGIGNRYAFDRHLDTRFVYLANGDPDDASSIPQQILVLIDLDGLKSINDRYGHSTGDDLLRRFAEGVEEGSKGMGEVFRLGGDEFAILSSAIYEERMVQCLGKLELHLIETGFPEAGISFGIAYSSEAENSGRLFTIADERMYKHKASRKKLRMASA